MLKYEKAENLERKDLAKRVGELVDVHPVYTRAPLYAYEISDYTVDRDGNLLVDETVESAGVVLTALMNEGMITGGVALAEDEAETAPDTASEDTAEEETSGEQQEEADGNLQEETDEEAEGENPGGETDGDSTEMEGLQFAFPLDKHSGVSLRNLVNLLYSRGKLVSKATGGTFSVKESLVEALKDDSCTYTLANFHKALKDYEAQNGSGLTGLEITNERVTFSGFPYVEDADHVQAFGWLAAFMNNQAIMQKRIQAKEVDDTNEKYAFRIWLLRMGMNGDSYKAARKVLMERLSGHTAFRTPEDAEKAKAKAQRQRDELRAAKAEAAAEAQLNAELSGLDVEQAAEAAEDAAYIAEVNALMEA